MHILRVLPLITVYVYTLIYRYIYIYVFMCMYIHLYIYLYFLQNNFHIAPRQRRLDTRLELLKNLALQGLARRRSLGDPGNSFQ